ncbi:MAG: type II toxin-antitoxin system Phd/YefM family antitoxin [Alphaproteobacteria bacterium]|nr:type II toxin-antitoxin system Phd/YefM family antitoxin [Alphaproteobacteria bacterium]
MADFVSLYDAKTGLSKLVERAAAGEEIVITKNGVPMAKLVPAPRRGKPRRPAHALGLKRIAKNFDEPLPASIQTAFEGRG